MIQRIQSVFLLLVAGLLLASLFLPFWTKNNPNIDEKAHLTAWNLSRTTENKPISTESTIYIGLLAIAAGGLAIFEIFQYKKRRFQTVLGAVNSFVIAGVIGSVLYVSTQKGEILFSPSVMGSYAIGYYLAWGAFVFNILSNRFIRRDELLVRSSDRLR
ncbi:MAG: DUF4293 domain-containing protein [Verrucomicrobia bacterium]|nr:DUF4293 domain-containing protein [Cytophagales bacterium]